MKIYIENGQIKHPAIIVQDDTTSAPLGYTEGNSIEDISYYGLKAIDPKISGWSDKKCVRDKLKIAVYTKMQITSPLDVEDQNKWDLLSDREKSIAAHWFLVGKESFQLEVVNEDRYWVIKAIEYRKWTEEVKTFRLRIMEAIVFRRTSSISDAKQILSDLSQIYVGTIIDIEDSTKKLREKVRVKRMNDMYVEGITSHEDDGEAGLRDFVNSEAGTPFENNGFRDYTYSFRENHTANSVADEILEVIDSKW